MYNLSSLRPILKDETTVITTPVRLVSGCIYAPQQSGDFPSGKYEVTVAFDANDDPDLLSTLRTAIEAADGRGRRDLWHDNEPTDYYSCLRQEKTYDEAGCPVPTSTHFLVARSDYEPRHFDASRRKLNDASEFYPGCLVRLQVEFYAWYRSAEQRGGVSAVLYAVQKIPTASSAVDMDDFAIPHLDSDNVTTEQLIVDAVDSVQDDGVELPK